VFDAALDGLNQAADADQRDQSLDGVGWHD
jgi:hypothetical protein